METLTDLVGDSERINYVYCKDIMSQMKVALPAIIEDVNYENQTLNAKPVTIMKTTNSSGVVSDFDMPLLQDVPFQCYKGGGYYITVPVKEGDECLIVFTDVDFSAWWQNGGFQYSEHSFLHSYSNAVAIIGLSSEVNSIPNYSSSAIEIRNSDSTEKFSMSSGNITIKSATITLDGETTIQGKKFLEHIHGNGNQGANTTGVV